MFPIASPKATRMTAITTPATTSEVRVRAPAALFTDEAETDPPTGIPSSAPDSDVGDALADEVTRRVGIAAVFVGEVGGDARTLDEPDQRE